MIFTQAPGRTGGVAKPVYLAWRPKLNSNNYGMLAAFRDTLLQHTPVSSPPRGTGSSHQ